MKHLVCCLCLMLSSALVWGGEPLRLATSEWPPFTGQGSERRIAEDLVELALRNINTDFTVSQLPWSDALGGAESGSYDGLIVAWHTAERDKFLLFSRPILENRILAVSLDSAKFNVASIADLAGRRVGKIAGYTYGAKLDSATADNATLYKDDREAVQQLLAAEIDLILIDDLALRYLASELPEGQQAQLKSHDTLVILDLHFVLSRELAGAESILAAFNSAIDTMVADGSYNQVLGLHWLIADTDRDGVEEYIVGPQALDLNLPPGDGQYQVFEQEAPVKTSGRRVYRVGNQQYDNWEDARGAIIDEAQQPPGNRMIQENRYQIGVPL